MPGDVAELTERFGRILFRFPPRPVGSSVPPYVAAAEIASTPCIRKRPGFLGMSAEVLQNTYGHHYPDYLQGAAAAIGQKGRYVSVVESVVDTGTTSDQNKKPKEIWSEW